VAPFSQVFSFPLFFLVVRGPGSGCLVRTPYNSPFSPSLITRDAFLTSFPLWFFPLLSNTENRSPFPLFSYPRSSSPPKVSFSFFPNQSGTRTIVFPHNSPHFRFYCALVPFPISSPPPVLPRKSIVLPRLVFCETVFAFQIFFPPSSLCFPFFREDFLDQATLLLPLNPQCGKVGLTFRGFHGHKICNVR